MFFCEDSYCAAQGRLVNVTLLQPEVLHMPPSEGGSCFHVSGCSAPAMLPHTGHIPCSQSHTSIKRAKQMDFFIAVILVLFFLFLYFLFFFSNLGYPLQSAKISLKRRGLHSWSQFLSSLPKKHFCEHPMQVAQDPVGQRMLHVLSAQSSCCSMATRNCPMLLPQ